jgi:CheY-like chemotaxis protein
MSPEREFLPSSDAVAPAPGVLPVLIVDDEPDILAMLRDLLEEAGFVVLTARDGRAALALLAHTPVALVLTDLMMPQVTGLQLAEQMRSDPRTAAIPVLAMSAALPSHMADVFAAVLPKPFGLDDLVATLIRFTVNHTSAFPQSGLE